MFSSNFGRAYSAHDVEEEQYLLDRTVDVTYREENLLRKWRAAALLIVIILSLMSAMLLGIVLVSSAFESSHNSSDTITLLRSTMDSVQNVNISINSGYGTATVMPYPFLKDGHLMEPYRKNVVTIDGLSTSVLCATEWDLVLSSKKPEPASLIGFRGQLPSYAAPQFTVTPQTTGMYILSLQQTCAHSTSTGPLTVNRTAQFTVWVKYVRRELLSLTHEDREEFLDALHTLWEVNTVDGQRRYGAQYKSLHYFAMIHNDAAGNGVCDEFHGGLGFVNNHVYLSSFLEQSLQLVNPRVALHYMDYSKYFESDAFLTGHLSNTMDGGAWTEILTAKWFGANDPITGRITDGRWRNSPVPMVDDDFFAQHGINKSQLFFPAEADRWLPLQSAHMRNTNGQLRARWNLNPVNYTTRYNNVDRIVNAQNLTAAAYDKYRGVPCENYYDFVQNYVSGRPLETLLANMEGRVHGPIHFTFGGAGGEKYHANDDEFRTHFNLTDSDLALITQLSHTYMKSEAPKWWTGGKERLNWNCTFPTPLAAERDKIREVQAHLDDAGALNWPGESHGTYCDANSYFYQSEDTLNEFIDLFFEPLAAASRDLANKFRALAVQDKRNAVHMLNTRYQFDGDIATSSAAIDPLFWVQHGAVERLYQRILFEDVLRDKAYTSLDKCSGHSADGLKYWLTGLPFADPSVRPELLTNAQLAEILDPTTTLYRDYVNFVYDTSSFGFCAGFESLFDNTRITEVPLLQ